MEFEEQLVNSFGNEDDLAVVLRSHIVIEQYLIKFIKYSFKNECHFDSTKFQYSQIIQLALACGIHSSYEPILKALGTLRNNFAHNIRAELNKNDANNLYNALSPGDKEQFQSRVVAVSKQLNNNTKKHKNFLPREQVINVIAYLAGLLDAVCKEVGEKYS